MSTWASYYSTVLQGLELFVEKNPRLQLSLPHRAAVCFIELKVKNRSLKLSSACTYASLLRAYYNRLPEAERVERLVFDDYITALKRQGATRTEGAVALTASHVVLVSATLVPADRVGLAILWDNERYT